MSFARHYAEDVTESLGNSADAVEETAAEVRACARSEAATQRGVGVQVDI